MWDTSTETINGLLKILILFEKVLLLLEFIIDDVECEVEVGLWLVWNQLDRLL